MKKALEEYNDMGWGLVAIKPNSKVPRFNGWQNQAQQIGHWDDNPCDNVGIVHGLSGTCVLDVDNTEETAIALASVGINLSELFKDSVSISGNPERGKLIYKMPDAESLTTKQLNWGKGVIFELRGGSSQDILPPSIHPDTGRPYSWHGEHFSKITELPIELLQLWQSWDAIKYQLENACPWRFNRATEPRPRDVSDASDMFDGISVIDEYNKSVSIETALEDAGFIPRGRKRWISPLSSSQVAGVVTFDDGRGFSHHGSDPFDGKSFDAFEVFVQFTHGGNFSDAVKEAANLFEISQLPVDTGEAQRHGARVWATWQANALAKAKAKADPRTAIQDEPQVKLTYSGTDKVSQTDGLDGIPEHLLSIGGVLGDVVDYYNRTANKPQPQFAVQTALAFGSVVLGRNWVTNVNNYTALYFINVALSGTGKEHTNTVLGALLEKSKLEHKTGPRAYTSESGLFSALLDRPSHVCVMDEFGLRLQGSNHDKSKSEVNSAFMTVYTRVSTKWESMGYSMQTLSNDQKDKLRAVIRRPSLTLVGMTTPSTFYDGISSDYIVNGFLGRFIIVESKIDLMKMNYNSVDNTIPDSITNWAKSCTPNGDLREGTFDVPIKPRIVHFLDEATELLEQFDGDMIIEKKAMRKFGMEELIGRSHEISMRVALIVSVSKGETAISRESVAWAIDYVKFYADKSIVNFKDELSEGPFQKICNKIFIAIKKAGDNGITEARLSNRCAPFRNLEASKRKDVFEVLKIDRGVHQKIGMRKGVVNWFSPDAEDE